MWKRVKGSALAASGAVPILAGDLGALLLSATTGPKKDPCKTPHRESRGTPVSFYDARTHEITRVSGDVQLSWFAAASLPDGRVIVGGGYERDALKPTQRTRLWDPRTRKWAEGAPMTIGRSDLHLVTMADGRVMAAGGMASAGDADCPDCETETDAVELYDPSTNTWTPTSPLRLVMPDTGDADSLSEVIALSGGQVLAIGQNESAALYDPGTGRWTSVPFHGGGFGSIALRDGTALSFGIEGFMPGTDEAIWFAAQFDPTGGTQIVAHWSPVDSAATAALGDGRVISVGGVVEDDTGYLNRFLVSAEVFDPHTGQLLEIASMPAVRGSSSAVLLADGSVLVVGGIDDQEVQEDTPGCVPIKYRVMRWVP
jgi:hypothetical protein